MKLSKLLAAFFVSTFIFSCNSTKITSSFKTDNAIAAPYSHIMVWAILTEKDSIVRKQMETHLVNDLIGKGYHAVSSVQVYESKAYKKFTSKEIVDEFKTTGIDAVITLVLLNKEKEDKFYPAGVFNQSINNDGKLDKYYSTIYEKVFTPGYNISSTNYFWEANLFQVANDDRIYSVRTSSFNPASTEALAHKNGQVIIKDMIKKKVIKDLNTTGE